MTRQIIQISEYRKNIEKMAKTHGKPLQTHTWTSSHPRPSLHAPKDAPGCGRRSRPHAAVGKRFAARGLLPALGLLSALDHRPALGLLPTLGLTALDSVLGGARRRLRSGCAQG